MPVLAYSSMKELKIDSTWKGKFDSNEWDYIYLKSMNAISTNVFENKKEKFKLILQKETHYSDVKNYADLVDKNCESVGKRYEEKNIGKSEIINIKNKKICYIEYKNFEGIIVRQFVYPELNKSNSYELFTYTWQATNLSTRDSVSKFVQGFLK
jgi:hypothetical protein